MANPIIQYFKDTRSELNHVAWPTQQQTIVYTILVALISLGVAAYLGAFDLLFTTALTDLVNYSGNVSAQNAIQVSNVSTSTTPTSTAANTTGPTFTITPSTGSTNTTK
jgi:preprotein translocase SecE subunit